MNEFLLLELIITDNETMFTETVNKNTEILDYCFGRFPMLSVLYLFNAKKITKKYENKLISKKEFIIKDEPLKLSIKFSEAAKKSLRLYNSSDKIVNPIEMLAILDNIPRTERLYKQLRPTNLKENLKKIYKLNYNQVINFKANKILYNNRPINYSQKKFALTSILTTSICLFVCILALILTPMFSSAGNISTPLNISSSIQFRSVDTEKESHFILSKDIKTSFKCSNFIGNLDGKGNSITIKNANKPLFENLKGTISNTTFIIENQTIKISNSRGILFNKMSGNLINCKIILNNIDIEEKSNDEICNFSLIEKNNGLIENLNLKLNINLTGENKSSENSIMSSICTNNNGDIKNVLIENSILTSKNVSIGGICFENNGDIENINSNLNINLNGENEINPIAVGMNFYNYGIIKNSQNSGNITVISNTPKDNAKSVTSCGLVYQNFSTGEIIECKNLGNITANSNYFAICSGITITNNNIISMCENLGIISTTTSVRCYTSGISIENNNKILESKNNGKVQTNANNNSLEAYITGISTINQHTIENCENNKEIVILSSNIGYCSGISNLNYGIIKTCSNDGILKANSIGKIYLGGITSFNYYQLSNSKNTGDLEANSEKNHIYLGGITGYGDYYMINILSYINSQIYECYSNCTIKSVVNNEAYNYIGGIAGYHYGVITKTYSLNNYDSISNKNLYLGGIIGIASINSSFDSTNSNLFKSSEKVSKGICKLSTYSGLDDVEDNINNDGCLGLTEQEIKQSEVYWE